MNTIVVDNRLEVKKQPQYRVFSDIYTDRLSDVTRKHRTKVMLLASAILYLKYSNVELTQLGWLKFSTAASSPIPLLYAVFFYFVSYFLIGAVLDNRKFKACKSFEVWDKFEQGFHFIEDNIKASKYDTNTQAGILNFVANVNSEYNSASITSGLQTTFYWVLEIGLPVALTFMVVLNFVGWL